MYASTSFYIRLVRLPRWQQLPLTVAAQAVQRSAFPDAYARWELRAARLVAGTTGADATALTCQTDDFAAVTDDGTGAHPPEEMGPDGLTPRTRTVRDAVIEAFAVTDIGGYCRSLRATEGRPRDLHPRLRHPLRP